MCAPLSYQHESSVSPPPDAFSPQRRRGGRDASRSRCLVAPTATSSLSMCIWPIPSHPISPLRTRPSHLVNSSAAPTALDGRVGDRRHCNVWPRTGRTHVLQSLASHPHPFACTPTCAVAALGAMWSCRWTSTRPSLRSRSITCKNPSLAWPRSRSMTQNTPQSACYRSLGKLAKPLALCIEPCVRVSVGYCTKTSSVRKRALCENELCTKTSTMEDLLINLVQHISCIHLFLSHSHLPAVWSRSSTPCRGRRACHFSPSRLNWRNRRSHQLSCIA
jgi:hypothetical protein